MQAIKYLLLVYLGIAHVDGFATEYNETLKNNEASGYVNMLESFIHKASAECRPLLQQDDIWRDNLIGQWLSDNQSYTRAVRLWTDFYISKIGLQNGEGVAQYEEQKIRSVIEMRGSNITRDIIKGNEAEKTLACEEFENKLRKGELNVSEQSPHYSQLQKMLELYQ